MQKILLAFLTILCMSTSLAACDYLIDDFESGINDWSSVREISLIESDGNNLLYADVSAGIDISMSNINLLSIDITEFNLSFRYRFTGEQSEFGGRYVGISDQPNDFDCEINSNCWSSYRSDYDAFADAEVGIWKLYSKSLSEFINDGNAGDGINSLTLEPAGSVEIDDIKLIKKQYYSCSEWGGCSFGIQSRDCVELESCGWTSPETQRICTLWEPFVVLGILLIASGILKLRKKSKPSKRKTKSKKKK